MRERDFFMISQDLGETVGRFIARIAEKMPRILYRGQVKAKKYHKSGINSSCRFDSLPRDFLKFRIG